LAKLQGRVQLLNAALLLLTMEIVAPNALKFCGEITESRVHVAPAEAVLTVRATVAVEVS
jgi:hypothetical protein